MTQHGQISGVQRVRNLRTKTRIMGARQLREFLAGKLPWLPCAADQEQDATARELERVYALGFEAGRIAHGRAASR